MAMPTGLAEYPAFAICCGLGVSTVAEQRKEVAEAFYDMFAKYSPSCVVAPNSGPAGLAGAYIVAISLPPAPTTIVEHDVPLVALDFLSFLGFYEKSGIPPRVSPHLASRDFTKVAIVEKNRTFDVSVCFINDPSSFYVHFLEETEAVEDLQKDLQTFYAKNFASMRAGLLAPGMVVAAVFQDDGIIYRARVRKVSLPNVSVHFVDYGNASDVHWSQLFKLADRFISAPNLAVYCSLELGHLRDGWTAQILTLFRDLVSDKVLRLRVVDTPSNYVVRVAHDNVDVNKVIQRQLDLETGARIRDHLKKKREENVTVPDAVKQTPVVPVADVIKKTEEEEEWGIEYVVTHIDSPSRVFVRPKYLDVQWNEYDRLVSRTMTAAKIPITENYLEPNMPVAVLLNGKHWRRGRVVRTCGEDCYEIALLDRGNRVVVSAEDLSPLPRTLRKKNAFCLPAKVIGMVPAGGSKDWTNSGIERFVEMLSGKDVVWIKTKGEATADEKEIKIVRVEMFVKEKDVVEAFKPTTVRFVSMASKMIEAGFALRDRRTSAPSSSPDAAAPEAGKTLSVISNCGSDVDPAEISADPAEIRADPAEISADPAEISADHSGLVSAAMGAKWPSPLVNDGVTFEARVTYIDDEGQLYMQSTVKRMEVKSMEKTLRKIYGEMTLADSDQDIGDWAPGDIGIAEYPENIITGWFRIQVQSVDEEGLGVFFVDYGEPKVLEPARDRCFKRVPQAMLRLPVQCVRCKLDNVLPVDGRYETDFLDEAHPTLVDKRATVEVTRAVKRFPLPVIVHLKDEENTNVARMFVNRGACEKVRKENKRLWNDPEAVARQDKAACGIQPAEM